MDRHTKATTLSLLFLLVVAARSSEAESSVRNRVAGQSEHSAVVQSDPKPAAFGANGSLTDVLFEDVIPQGRPGAEQQGKKQEVAEGVEWEDEYEDYEEEYVDELKAVVAESHEAMSKDETKNPNVTSPQNPLIADRSPSAKSFESHEVTVVDDSDEDVASNEAITAEVVEKNDREVAELLKYIKEKNASTYAEGKTKTKRVPTVKKELSTQKEILVGSNETQVPKSLTAPKDILNRLNEETEPIKCRNVEKDQPMGLESVEEGTYVEGASGEVREKMDKRQETVLKDLKSYLLTEYTTKEEQRQKLRELGAQEDALAENLLKLLVKLAENPGRWERLHKLLVNMENDLKLPRNTLEPSKRGYETTTTLLSTTLPSPEGPRKSRKKFKKKKKKPRHDRSTTTTSTTMTSVPVTPPLLTTTEQPWQTTPVQWRLVAERLFGPPWQEDLQEEPQEDPENGPKVRYSVASKPRTLPSMRELIDQNKSKAGQKAFSSERKPAMMDAGREMNGQRLLRFGKVNTHQPSHIQGHREFTGVYDRPSEPDRLPEYEVPESYPRLRYNQLTPGSREYLHQRHDDDYQEDFNLQTDNFAHSQDYRPPNREYAISKSWPDIPYKYPRPWNPEDRSLLQAPSGKWPWRQPQTDTKYWPQRNKFLQPERTYWPSTENEEEMDDGLPQHNWSRDRQNGGWAMEKSLKVPPAWQPTGRSIKPYDRDQPASSWEKSKYLPELNRSSSREDSKDKAGLPQITMRTWNSLTSDPATWPYKLPGAKPWPKDENGKSYNPNAELVKKLGLDKQTERPYDAESSHETSKVEDPSTKHRTFDDKSELSDYKGRSRSNGSVKSWSTIMAERKSTKDWKPRDSEEPQNDDESVWGGKYEGAKNSWHTKDSLPKIQSVGAWVMPADQSTWKPYQIKSIENVEEDSSRRWSSKPSSMSRSWPEKMNDPRAWMEESTNMANWEKKTNDARSWTEKSGKWFSKTSDSDAWRKKIKGDPSWLTKPSESPGSAWPSKIVDNNPWAVKVKNSASWSTKANESGSWRSDPNDDSPKYPNPESWSTKSKSDDPWSSKSSHDTSSWKTNDPPSWSRKSGDQIPWTSKNSELGSWQQKINDEWNYGKNSGSAGTWPSKWKQFAYHRVTAMPISKPGTTADAAASAKSKNAFVAVFAVSSPKYTANEWRKNEEEARGEGTRSEDGDRANGQVQVGLERPIYAWNNGLRKGNGTDQLENQLEALRQIDFWPYKENEAEKEPTDSTRTTTSPSAPATTNLTTVATDRRSEVVGKVSEKLLESHRQAIPMK